MIHIVYSVYSDRKYFENLLRTTFSKLKHISPMYAGTLLQKINDIVNSLVIKLLSIYLNSNFALYSQCVNIC